MKQSQFKIFSIFGQIEEVVSLAMIAEGKACRIDVADFPPRTTFEDLYENGKGQWVKFGLLMAGRFVPEFERRIAELRA